MTLSPYTIRQATADDAEGITIVHVNSFQTSYVGIIDPSFLENMSFEKRLELRKEILGSKRGVHLVIELRGQISGFADGGLLRLDPVLNHLPIIKGKEETIGEIYAIYLLEEHKRKGIGKALFRKCREWFSQHELHSFIVWVLKNNLKARRFYESEDGHMVAQKIVKMGEKEYEDVAYWFPHKVWG